MCVHVHSLSDDCLLPIFDRIPLLDLLRLYRVCHRWAKLLRSACARRRTLVLIGGRFRADEICFRIPFNDSFEVSFDGGRIPPRFGLPLLERENSLTLPFLLPNTFVGGTEEDLTELPRFRYTRFSGQLVTHLKSLFLNVKTLVVIHTYCKEEDVRSLVGLVGSFSLVTLKLWLHVSSYPHEDVDYNKPANLLQSINRQSTTLQQLNLDFLHSAYQWSMATAIPTESFAFLAQLKVAKLNFGFTQHQDSIRHIVGQFKNSSQLCHLGIGFNNVSPLDSVLNPQFEFATKVHQLYGFGGFGGLRFESVEQLGIACQRFVSLTSIQIDMYPNKITFIQLVNQLACLTQLTCLSLHAIRLKPFFVGQKVVGGQHRILSLPQVKILELYFVMRVQHDFWSLSQLVFPSVELIILRDGCISCNTCCSRGLSDKVHEQMTENCHQLLIDSLKSKFANSLIRLYSLRNTFGDWSVHEVLSEDGYLPGIVEDGHLKMKRKEKKKKMMIRMVMLIALKRKMSLMKMMKKKKGKMLKMKH